MNIPTRIGLGILFLGVVIVSSYGTKLHIDNLPYTLKHLENFQGESNAKKFGSKFAKYLISNDSTHKLHNRVFWERNARKLASSSEELLESGLLRNLKQKKLDYNSAKDSDKPEKFKELVNKLIIECTSKYNDSTNYAIDTDSDNWKEYWAYCSLDGKNRWEEQKNK